MINFLEKTKTLFSLLPIKAASCLYSDTFLRYQGSVVWETKPCECSTFGSSGSTIVFRVLLTEPISAMLEESKKAVFCQRVNGKPTEKNTHISGASRATGKVIDG